MREFMTRLSDYWNERRNDPDRQENKLAVIVMGAVAIVIIILLVVLLWGYAGKGKNEKKIAVSGQTEALSESDLDKTDADMDEEGVSQKVYEEETVKYMSEDSGEKLRQEYLTSTAYLQEKVEELLQTMTQVQEGLKEVEKSCQEADDAMRAQITTLCKEVDTIVLSLKETQVKLTDLTDIVQVIDREKIPVIQQQIEEVRQDMESIQTAIAGLHAQMAALKKEDEKLWASISKLEKTVKNALNQNVAEVNNRLDQLQAGMDHLSQEFEKILRENMEGVNERVDALIGRMEEQISALREKALSYRYEPESQTLYLIPMKEREDGQ